ncbi:hypothetical protein [Sulfurirhabdus autotrophica]|uniref:Patatin-like phospholipase n=1 Tax=Sulfurirhabdus autotrophica TaxID=1706046 RepID=A0A4R3YDP0_9PROT|nr:hypothetical protein [Sulfurirhabdus autotrophica]TCV90625.1 patatin-like phospholipase [Sulfurirhabdus autotrophica]
MNTNQTDIPDKAINFKTALNAEKAHINSLRNESDGSCNLSQQTEFIGLSLSGGGIRSATFNLGIIQSLAKLDMLKHLDYLSTVSGGGYIGSWLSALIYHSPEGLAGAQEILKPKNGSVEEAPPIRFLRRYSNYLTPKLGIFSGDTLAAIATYLRNFGLNLIPIISLAAAFILFTHLLTKGAVWGIQLEGIKLLGASIILIIIAVTLSARSLAAASCPQDDAAASCPLWAWAILIFTLVACLLSSFAMMGGDLDNLNNFEWTVLGAVAYGFAWGVGYVFWRFFKNNAYNHSTFSYLIITSLLTLLTGAVAGWLLHNVSDAVKILHNLSGSFLERAWWAVTICMPLVALTFAATVALHIGLLARALSHEAQEWWSRIGGMMLGTTVVWSIAFTLAGLAPVAAIWAKNWTIGAGGLWALASGSGVWLARSRHASGKKSKRWARVLARATPYVFITGFAAGVSTITYSILSKNFCDYCLPESITSQKFATIAQKVFLNMHQFQPDILIAAFACCIGVFTLAGWRFDINLFSIHHFYRNRLVRAYLGAARFPDRKTHPFTGFSPDDDVRMCCLRNQLPYHIINTALNISGGEELAWQARRAASFTFTPLYSGFEYRSTRSKTGGSEDQSTLGGFRPTEICRSRWGIHLGTAMSISGAAASPLSGYHTEPALAALMTIFNVRLGQWIGNPTDKNAWKYASPGFGGWYLLKELSATTDAHTKYLYLSDGGHFENLGIYELVRRHCKLIISVDAGCDPKYTFDDLANAIRKCYIDMGTVIDINVDELRAKNKHCKAHYAAGVIQYNKDEQGVLLYIKASLTGEEDPDILNYAKNHPDFPHDTTADQNFDEDQFESYRKLGEHVGSELFSCIKKAAESNVEQGSDHAKFISAVTTMKKESLAKTQSKNTISNFTSPPLNNGAK